jgi:alpha-D-xyloside xylohydrolase
MRLFWKTPAIFAREKTKALGEKNREVYLPAHHLWYDFWTGDTLHSGQKIKTDAPIDKLPLFVKSGSIIPMGPLLQYSTERPANPIELRIYPGENGSFTLYEDEGDTYNYEKGIYSVVGFRWDDQRHELTVGKCKGQFPGMLNERTFDLVLVTRDHGTGLENTDRCDRKVAYRGEEIMVKLP